MFCLLVVLVKLSYKLKLLARKTPLSSESSPLQFLAYSVTNLNEPPRALATSTIMWVRSQFHPFCAVVNKSNAG